MACSRSAREARPDSASTPTDWGCGSSTDEAALVASCGQVGGAAVPACASHVERQCKRACAVMPVRVDMWAWALRMHARTDAHARRCTPAPAAQVHTTTADIRRCIVASDTPLRRRCAQGWRAWCSRGDSKTFAKGLWHPRAGRESDVSTLQMGKNARGKDLASIATATQSYERGARALVAVRIQHASNHIGEAERRSQVCELRRTLEVSGEN